MLNKQWPPFGVKICSGINLSVDIILSKKQKVFLEQTLSFEEQIMFKDEYPSIFSYQMEAIVFINLQIFLVTWAVLKIGNIAAHE